METEWVPWPLMKEGLGNMCSFPDIFVDYLCDSINPIYKASMLSDF